jgi:DNA-binding NarL/FixJ family response regulator
MINLLLVEDNHKVRELLAGLLQAQKNFNVVAKADNGWAALEVLQNGLQADIVVADLNMHDMDGIELTEQIMSGYPNLKVIILTMHAKAAFLNRALTAGARGYLLKNGDMQELYQAISQVHAGEVVVGASVSQ